MPPDKQSLQAARQMQIRMQLSMTERDCGRSGCSASALVLQSAQLARFLAKMAAQSTLTIYWFHEARYNELRNMMPRCMLASACSICCFISSSPTLSAA